MSDKTIIYTDGGAVSIRGKWFGGWGFAGTGADKVTFSGYGACKSPSSTNNVAEMDAYVKACEFVVKKGFTDVTFKLDSQYVLKGANKYLPLWEGNNWLTRQGLPVKNKQQWLKIKAIRQKLDDNNIAHDYEWVKGHSGVLGNELADKGATQGIAKAKVGDYTPVYSFENSDIIEKVKKTKVTLPKLLSLRRMPFITNTEVQKLTIKESEYFIYNQTNFDDKQNVRSKYYGRQGTDVIEGVLFSKNRIEALDTVKDRLSKIVGKDIQIPAILQLDKILSKNNLASITAKGDSALSVIGDDVLLDGDTLLGYPVYVPLLSVKGHMSLNYKYTLLTLYLDGLIKPEHVLDVTDKLFDTDDKGKQKLKTEILKVCSVPFDMKLKGGLARTALMPNVNFPQFNKLGGAAKEEGGVKVSVILHNVSNKTFQYSFIVECGNGDFALFDSPDSNLRVLK